MCVVNWAKLSKWPNHYHPITRIASTIDHAPVTPGDCDTIVAVIHQTANNNNDQYS